MTGAVQKRKRECDLFADQLEQAFGNLATGIIQAREAVTDIQQLTNHDQANEWAKQLGYTDINSMVMDRYANALATLKSDKAELREAREKLSLAGLGHAARAALLGTQKSTEAKAARRAADAAEADRPQRSRGGQSPPQDQTPETPEGNGGRASDPAAGIPETVFEPPPEDPVDAEIVDESGSDEYLRQIAELLGQDYLTALSHDQLAVLESVLEETCNTIHSLRGG